MCCIVKNLFSEEADDRKTNEIEDGKLVDDGVNIRSSLPFATL